MIVTDFFDSLLTSFSSYNSQSTIKFKLLHADGMVLEVIERFLLPIDVSVRDDLVLEQWLSHLLTVFIEFQFFTLDAATDA